MRALKHISLFVEQAGKGLAPAHWGKAQIINIQRLYYIKSGTGYIFDTQGRRIAFEPQTIYLFPYNFPQDFVTDPDDRIDHMYIDFLSTPPVMAGDMLTYPVEERTPLSRMVSLLDSLIEVHSYEGNCESYISPPSRFHHIVDAPDGSRAEYYQTLYALIQALLLMLNAQKAIPFAADDAVTHALQYMNQNYQKEIRVEEMARQSGYQARQFSRRFKKVMGMTPYQYLLNYRLYLAVELISKGATVKEAAEQVGYANASSLSRELRRRNLTEGV